jgi:hypothetical protein
MFTKAFSSASAAQPAADVTAARRRSGRSWWSTYGFVLGATMLMALLATRTFPTPFSLALLLFLVTAAVSLARPVVGIYVVVFLAVLGDPLTVPSYPFQKNLSSQESMLFISRGISFSPLEVCLGALLVGWLLRMMTTRRWTVHKGRLFTPLIVFTGFMLFGLAHGLTSGGDRNAALWEFRTLLYLPVLYVVITNLFERREQYVRLYAYVMVAVFLNSLLALWNYQGLSDLQREGMESFVSHGATLSMNAMVILLLASWMFRQSSWAWRMFLPFMLVPVTYMYLASQRRAAFVALIAALGVVGAVLLWTNRRAFWRVVPIVLIIGTVYTAAFWHDETSTAGFPAQAVKSVIAPNDISERNQSSDLYRIVEKQDILATIRSSPITGIGFGKPFLRPFPLPQINFFLLAPYMPHNSVLWIWIKGGIGGFIALIYLFGVAMHTGARAVLAGGRGDHAATVLTSVTFVLMYAIFSYVDIGWDPQNMVLLAVAMAQIGNAARLAPRPAAETAPGRERPTIATGEKATRVMGLSHAG